MDMGEKKKPGIIMKISASSPTVFKVISSSHPVEIVKRKLRE